MRWLAVVLVLVVAGCGSDRSAERDDPVAAPTATTEATSPAPRPAPPPATIPPAATTEATTEAPATRCVAGGVVELGSKRHALAATVPRRATAHREPDGAQLASFERLNVNRYPTTFGVLAKRVDGDCRATWYRVQLPLRPNGITGWVRATEVELHRVTTRILVELSARRVTLYEAGRQTFTARAAIGSSATPTPTGSYYVNQRLVPSDPSGPFGPGAIGISAFSPVLTGWAQGGPIAIHGTNRPDLIGQAVSNGCIRLRNDDLLRLFERSPAGTPVLVRA